MLKDAERCPKSRAADKERKNTMAVNRTPVLKRCRSLDLDPTFLGYDKKSKRQLIRRSRKLSEYGTQLREKQKAKFIYGVLEKPFRNYYDKADRMKGMTGENLMTMLESRLDNVVFRMGFARTRREARQVVGHKHITVNGKVVNVPSYLCKAGDVIAVRHTEVEKIKSAIEANSARPKPSWMDVDSEHMSATVTKLPDRSEIDFDIEEHFIVELYSK
jgi:small subunit ribosomal protein S4